tara:strand:- start:1554 stop:2435 length:882 start_codon:yes stop_codon:yes gene_type:complete
MKALIIGLGSIGIKHYNLLKSLNSIKKIRILSKRKKKNLPFIDKRYIKNYDPDYIIISNLTSEHLNTLKEINRLFINKLILVEKPLFHKFYNFNSKRNKIFVCYNMRFHPVISYLKKYISKEKFNLASIQCRTNLKKWRKNIKYNKSNTSKKSGGGALLELSHELDYLKYIFGNYDIKYSVKKKLSKLKIKSDDFFHLIGTSKKLKYFDLKVSIFDNKEERSIKLSNENNFIEADILKNRIKFFDGKKIYEKKFKKLNTLNEIHKKITSKKFQNICSLSEGKKILSIVGRFKY